MLNILWPFFIILSIIYGFISGSINSVNMSIFESTENAINLSITLLGTMSFWNGIMEIANKTSIIERLSNALQPIINLLFPEIKSENKIKKEISMNIIANILGLGNASTPIGLRVMKLLQEKNTNPKELSNYMSMFIVINTVSLQLIPTTVIAIRSSIGSNSPTRIIIPVWISTITSAITAIIITKILIKRGR